MNTFETEFVGTDGLALPFFRGCFYCQMGVSPSAPVLNRTHRPAWRGPRVYSHRGILGASPRMTMDPGCVGGNHVDVGALG